MDKERRLGVTLALVGAAAIGLLVSEARSLGWLQVLTLVCVLTILVLELDRN
jgi:hypothetical protein